MMPRPSPSSLRLTTRRRVAPSWRSAAALAELEGGCMIPLGAWGRDTEDGRLALNAGVFDENGVTAVVASETGSLEEPEELGRSVAKSLRLQGAVRLLRRG